MSGSTAGTTAPSLTILGSPDAISCDGDACLTPALPVAPAAPSSAEGSQKGSR
jgi:hypothetical protein